MYAGMGHYASGCACSGTDEVCFSGGSRFSPHASPRRLGEHHRVKSVPSGCVACIGKCRSKGFGALPNKHFATQNKQMYIRLHCLPQQYDLSVRIQLLSVLSQFSKISALSHSRRQSAYSKISCSMEAGAGALHRSGAANQGKEQGTQSVG